MKVLAIDFGEKRIGLAVGNTVTRTATPIGQIARQRDAAAVSRIGELILSHEISQVIIGHPLNMDGTPSPFCSRVERFAERLSRRLRLPVELVDERLTSREAEALAGEISAPARRRKNIMDSLAAHVLLRSYMKIS